MRQSMVAASDVLGAANAAMQHRVGVHRSVHVQLHEWLHVAAWNKSAYWAMYVAGQPAQHFCKRFIAQAVQHLHGMLTEFSCGRWSHMTGWCGLSLGMHNIKQPLTCQHTSACVSKPQHTCALVVPNTDLCPQVVPNTDLVVGDVLLLNMGDKVVADGIMIDGFHLVVDEASLTGEHMLILRSAGIFVCCMHVHSSSCAVPAILVAAKKGQ
jgi:hypothetical protein